MTWQDEENARQAALLRRQQEWEDEHRALPTSHWPADEWQDPAGFRPEPAPYPDALGDLPPSSDQPAAVLLAWQLGHRSDPAAVREEARSAKTAELAEPRLDGRDALRRMAVSRNPDGGNLSGSRALELIRQLGVAGVGHEPGCRP